MFIWFNNLKVSSKIGFGSGLILVLLMVVATIAYFGLTLTDNEFSNYRQIARQSNELGRIQSNVLSARIGAISFNASAKAAAVDSVRERVAATIDIAEAAKDLFTDPAALETVSDITQDIAAYRDAFENVVVLEARDQALNGKMDDLGPVIEKALSDRMEASFAAGDVTAARAASESVRELLMVRLYANRFAASSLDKDAQTTSDELAKLDQSLDKLAALQSSSQARNAIKSIKSDADTYGSTFEELVSASTQFNDIFDNTLNVLGPRIADEAENLKLKNKALQDEIGPRATANIQNTIMFAIVVSVLAVIIGIASALFVARLISKPISSMTTTMNTMAKGEYDIVVPAQDRKDEIGLMAKAVEVFRINGQAVLKMDAEKAQTLERERVEQVARTGLQEELGQVVAAAVAGDFSRRIDGKYEQDDLQGLATAVNTMMETVDAGISETGVILAALANTDLTKRMTGTYQGSFDKLKSDTNAVADKLTEIVGQLKSTSRGLRTATGEILSGANDLSERTTKQAATIEETSAAMEQLAATVAQNAERAEEASLKSRSMSQTAEEGGEVMSQANQAMEQITNSSSKIANIVGLMEDIAFQTNLLALNASVEAARAGEAGKGFAVVAVEVRRLAQSSAEASSEVKQLIEQSGSEVANGSQLVASATEKLEAILEAVMANNELMGGIAKESREQASAITEVNVAVRQMDEMTQHNAALVEETNAAIEQTETQATDLDRIVDIFRLSDTGRPHATQGAANVKPAEKPGVLQKVASGARALLTQGNAAIDEDWKSF